RTRLQCPARSDVARAERAETGYDTFAPEVKLSRILDTMVPAESQSGVRNWHAECHRRTNDSQRKITVLIDILASSAAVDFGHDYVRGGKWTRSASINAFYFYSAYSRRNG